MNVARWLGADRDVEPDDPGERAAGDDDVVERVVDGGPSGRGRRAGSGPRAPSASSIANSPATSLASTASSSFASTFERKPTLPRLMPSSGTSTSITARAARRNVPSPPRTTRTSVVAQLAAERLEVLGLGGPVVDAVHPAPARGPLAQLDRRLVGRVVGEADPAGSSRGRSPSAIRSRRCRRSSGRPGGGGGTRGCPPARGSARRSRRGRRARAAAACSTTRSRTARWTAGSRTTPWSVPPSAGLELGLDQGDDRRRRARGRSVEAIGPRTSPSEMNETSTTARSIGSREGRRGQRPGVRPLDRRRPADRARARSASWPRPTSTA